MGSSQGTKGRNGSCEDRAAAAALSPFAAIPPSQCLCKTGVASPPPYRVCCQVDADGHGVVEPE